jgi:hypothetical protein
MRMEIEEGWGLWWLGSARIGGGKMRSKVVILGCTRRRKMRVFGWDFGQKMDKTKWGWWFEFTKGRGKVGQWEKRMTEDGYKS